MLGSPLGLEYFLRLHAEHLVAATMKEMISLSTSVNSRCVHVIANLSWSVPSQCSVAFHAMFRYRDSGG